jgi:hypothetical protein
LAIGARDLRAVADVPLAVLLNDRRELISHGTPPTMTAYGKAIPWPIAVRGAAANGKDRGARMISP